MCSCLLPCPCACAFLCRHRPCCGRGDGPPDLLLFGDSSLDLWQRNARAGLRVRPGWRRAVDRFAADPLNVRLDAMACGGAPLYELLLASNSLRAVNSA